MQRVQCYKCCQISKLITPVLYMENEPWKITKHWVTDVKHVDGGPPECGLEAQGCRGCQVPCAGRYNDTTL